MWECIRMGTHVRAQMGGVSCSVKYCLGKIYGKIKVSYELSKEILCTPIVMTCNTLPWPLWPYWCHCLRGTKMAVPEESLPLISLGSQSIQIRAEASVVLTLRPTQLPLTFLYPWENISANRMAAFPLYLGLHETSWSCVKPSLPVQAPHPFLQFSFCSHSCL